MEFYEGDILEIKSFEDMKNEFPSGINLGRYNYVRTPEYIDYYEEMSEKCSGKKIRFYEGIKICKYCTYYICDNCDGEEDDDITYYKENHILAIINGNYITKSMVKLYFRPLV